MLDILKLINWDESTEFKYIYLVMDSESKAEAEKTAIEFFREFLPGISGSFTNKDLDNCVLVSDTTLMDTVYIYSGNECPGNMLLDPKFNGNIHVQASDPWICTFQLDPEISEEKSREIYGSLKFKCIANRKALLFSE